MLTAVVYGLLASSGLVIGPILGLVFSPPRRFVASVIAFGSGVLVSALTFELMEEAFDKGSVAHLSGGFLAGALIYVGMDYLLDRLAQLSPKREGRHPRDIEPGAAHRSESAEVAAVSGTALLVGAVLDGIPENAAIGISLYAEGRGLGLVLLAAVFLGNLPESIGSAVGMRQAGRSPAFILAVWGAAAIATTLATVAGYALLGGLSAGMVGSVLALAAGEIGRAHV